MKFTRTYEVEGNEVFGFSEDSIVYVCGNWRIYRAGTEGRFGGINNNAGTWEVERLGVQYGSFKSMKLAKGYIVNWLSYNPKDI